MHDNAGNRAVIEAKTREVLELPAIPILIGGDDSVPIPFLAGFADHGPIWILQIDAHIDWRDEVHGERYGYSNIMRRASEMPHVAGIVQVGIRSVGSARLTEIEAARHYGSRFVTARRACEGSGASLLQAQDRLFDTTAFRGRSPPASPPCCRMWSLKPAPLRTRRV